MEKKQVSNPPPPKWLVWMLSVVFAGMLFFGIFLSVMLLLGRPVRAAECGYDGPVIMALGEDGYGASTGLFFVGNGCDIEVVRGWLGDLFLRQESGESPIDFSAAVRNPLKNMSKAAQGKEFEVMLVFTLHY